MSNQDRAAKVIQETYALGGASQDAAKALAKSGLLMSDLPKEDAVSANGTPVWRPEKGLMVTAFHDGEVRMGIPPTYPDTEFREAIYTRQSANKQALALLAAAQYSKEQA